MPVKLLAEHHLEFLSLKGGRTGSSESTLVKMPHCWKSHVMAHLGKSKLILQNVLSTTVVIQALHWLKFYEQKVVWDKEQ